MSWTLYVFLTVDSQRDGRTYAAGVVPVSGGGGKGRDGREGREGRGGGGGERVREPVTDSGLNT
jgi:hypothetical protein